MSGCIFVGTDKKKKKEFNVLKKKINVLLRILNLILENLVDTVKFSIR